MNIPRDQRNWPLLPAGKFERIIRMVFDFGDFWRARQIQRIDEWGEFGDWGTSNPIASGETWSSLHFDSQTGEYDELWQSVVVRGELSNPRAIQDPNNQLMFDIAERMRNYLLDPETDPTIGSYESWVGARWFMFCFYQVAVAECLYKLIHYTPRLGAGRHD